MSKQEAARKIINYVDEPMLEELSFLDLLQDRARYSAQEYKAKAKKDSVSASLRSILETVKADSIVYEDARGDRWTTNLVVPVPGESLDEEKLKENMMKLGKLDAVLVAKIFEKSMVPKEAGDPYIRVLKPKKGSNGIKNGTNHV